jgi:DNA-directed RNA polymerase subunit M/transcription elongation factor TFIIS
MSNSAARLDPFDPETYDIFRAALAPPALRTSAARDIATWRATGQDGEPVGDAVSLQEAVWWERAVYERAVRLFERRILAVRVQGDASAYMTYAASRVPDLYYPHELRVLRNQLNARGGWDAVRALAGGVVLEYADLTTEQLRQDLPIRDWLVEQERAAAAHNEKLASAPSFAPASAAATHCRRCRSTNVTVNLRQLRSADEPMTQCFACLEPKCRYTWRVG